MAGHPINNSGSVLENFPMLSPKSLIVAAVLGAGAASIGVCRVAGGASGARRLSPDCRSGVAAPIGTGGRGAFLPHRPAGFFDFGFLMQGAQAAFKVSQ
jgi:hypothetical protein